MEVNRLSQNAGASFFIASHRTNSPRDSRISENRNSISTLEGSSTPVAQEHKVDSNLTGSNKRISNSINHNITPTLVENKAIQKLKTEIKQTEDKIKNIENPIQNSRVFLSPKAIREELGKEYTRLGDLKNELDALTNSPYKSKLADLKIKYEGEKTNLANILNTKPANFKELGTQSLIEIKNILKDIKHAEKDIETQKMINEQINKMDGEIKFNKPNQKAYISSLSSPLEQKLESLNYSLTIENRRFEISLKFIGPPATRLRDQSIENSKKLLGEIDAVKEQIADESLSEELSLDEDFSASESDESPEVLQLRDELGVTMRKMMEEGISEKEFNDLGDKVMEINKKIKDLT